MTRHGVNSRLYMGATTAAPIAETHGINVGIETDFAEDSSQGDTWKTYLPGLTDISIEFDKWFDQSTGGGALLAAVIARTSQKWYFYPDATDSTIYMYGASGYVGGGGFDAPIDNIVDQHYMFRTSAQPTYVHP
jgi:hypothetical protein